MVNSTVFTYPLLLCEIVECALVAERRALVLVLPFHAVGIYIAVNRERHAIFNPRLTEHLFGDEHFCTFALIVLAACNKFIEVNFAAHNARAHVHQRELFFVRRLEANSHTSTTRSFIKFSQHLEFVGVNFVQEQRVKVARIRESKHVVVSSSQRIVTLYHVRVECGVCVLHRVSSLSDGAIISWNAAKIGEDEDSPHILHNCTNKDNCVEFVEMFHILLILWCCVW